MKKLNITISLSAIFFLFFAGVTGDINPNQFNCVGSASKKGDSYAIPCVLIGSKYVLVPANSLIESKFRPKPLPGTNVIINEPYDRTITDINNIKVEFGGKTYDCDKVTFYPQFITDSLTGNCDIAIIKLKEEVTGITPAVINSKMDEEKYKVISLGADGQGNATKRQKLIDSLTGIKINNNQTQLFCNLSKHNFDDIKDWQSHNAVVLYQTSTDCELVGIGGATGYKISNTGHDQGHASFVEWTRVSAFADWIKENTAGN